MNPYDLPVDRTPPPEAERAGPKPGRTAGKWAWTGLRRDPVTLLAPSPTAASVLQWYIDNDGLAEQPPGSNHVPGVTDRCGLGDVAWCAEAVSIALMAGGFGSIADFTMTMPGLWTRYGWGWAYCPDIVQAFQDAGRWRISDPQPGDVVLFDWDGDNWADHVGIVEQNLGDGTVLTREGNTSANRLEQKRRSVQDILGYGRPPYSTEEDDMNSEQDQLLRDIATGLAEWKDGKLPSPRLDAIEARLAALEAARPITVDGKEVGKVVADELAQRLKA